MTKSGNEGTAKVLIVIGALIALYIGIMGILGTSIASLYNPSPLIFAVITLILGVLCLAVIFKHGRSYSMNGVIEIVLGTIIVILNLNLFGVFAEILIVIGGTMLAD